MKKAPAGWDYFHGTTKQNLLKLFDGIINNDLHSLGSLQLNVFNKEVLTAMHSVIY